MKAVICQEGCLRVADVPDLRPGAGQILINVVRAGICGSDVHMRDHMNDISSVVAATGQSGFAENNAGFILGHEFSGEILEYGPNTNRRWKPGTLMVAMPLCRHGRHPYLIGSSPHAPGSYAERMIVQEALTFPVPNGLPAEHATLTEPMSVAWHAVQRSRIQRRETAYVIGCGPVGLAAIALLKAAGVSTVIASDLSPRRRELAAVCGADVVVDPRIAAPFKAAPLPSRTTTVGGMVQLPITPWSAPGAPDELNLSIDAMERLRRFSMVPWWQLFKAMHKWDKGPSGPIVFECSGAKGMIDRLVEEAPPMSRIVVVGSCLEPDTIRPVLAQMKEIDAIFSVGYNPAEFREVLHMIAEGKVNPVPFLTGTVGFAGVDAAFDALNNPEKHAKILIDPQSSISSVL